MFLLALALAALVGVSLGLLGGGGSILAVPILRYVLGMEAHRAIALSLLVVGTTSLAALLPHARLGRIRWRTGIVFGGAAMGGAFVAGRLAHLVPEVVLLVGFALMMITTAIAMLRTPSPKQVQAGAAGGELPILKVLLEGVVVGAITGLVGAGGGFLVVPALVLLGGLPIELAVGTSLVVITMKSFAGFAGYAATVPIDWATGFAISLAAVAGSVGGGLLARRVKPAALRAAFGWFVVAMAIFILGQELPSLFDRTASPALAAGVALLATTLLAGGRALFSRRQKRLRSPDQTSTSSHEFPHPISEPAAGG
jgi:uncharacterized membrane protein YfcA